MVSCSGPPQPNTRRIEGLGTWGLDFATTLDIEMLLEQEFRFQRPQRQMHCFQLFMATRCLINLAAGGSSKLIRAADVGTYDNWVPGHHFGGKHYVTPTAYEPDETVPWLALP